MVKYALIALIFMLTMVSAVSAGTLISGSTVDVKSNYDGFKGFSLVGSWSTTPAVSDRLSITNAQLPKPYGLRETVDINVPAPTIEQVFRVTSQTPLYKASYVEKTYWTWNLPFGKSAADLCRESIQNDLATNYAGRPLLVEGVPMLVAQGYCQVQFVVIDQQNGWIGPVVQKGLYYYQDIDLDGVGKLHLERSDKADQLTDRIDGVGRATLLNFGTWTNAQLTDKNVYAYHGRNELGTDAWKPFDDTQGLSTYQSDLSALRAKFVSSSVSLAQFQTNHNTAPDLVQEINDENARLRGEASSLPNAWVGGVDGSVRTAANDLIVPMKRTAFTANIQLVLAGEKFGLFIPVGVPKIVSADSSLKFSETAQGFLKYTVQNIGTDTGTFVLKGTCDGSKVLTDEQEMTLKAGETKSGQLLVTAKSNTFSVTEDVACRLDLKETNTQKTDSKAFKVTIEVKASCVEGEETAPKLDAGGKFTVVQVLNAQCQEKARKECPVVVSEFQKVNGIWTCTDIKGAVAPPPPPPEKPQFRTWLFVAAGVVGLIVAFAGTYGIAQVLPRKSGARPVILLISFAVLIVLGAIGTALIINYVGSLVTLGVIGG